MNISNWLIWIGLFVTLSIVLSLLRKPVREENLYGPRDTPIHTKPFFKITSVFLLVLFFLTVFVMSS